MEKIKEFIKKHEFIDVILMSVIIIVLSCIIPNHMQFLYADRGREFLIPMEILNGKVPYKDITLIYFPLGYYINAIVYKLLGVKICSLIVSQAIFCILYITGFYFCAREFLARREALLVSILVIMTCIFAYSDLFNYIMPYSYSMVYGVFGLFFCTFALIKLYKTNKVPYAYLAALLAGFSFSCKFDFYIVWILLIVGLFLYKKLNIKQYIMVVLSSLVFPAITLGILFMQGVSFENIIEAINFGVKFAKTDAMLIYLSDLGMFPVNLHLLIYTTMKCIPDYIALVVMSIGVLKLYQKYSKPIIIFAALVISTVIFYKYPIIYKYWCILPIFILVLLAVKFKQIYNNEKALLILLLATLLVSQREFFFFKFGEYGTYAFPLLFLSLYIITKMFAFRCIFNVKTKDILCLITALLICIYSCSLYKRIYETQYALNTNKGTIYTNYYFYNTLRSIILYIETKTDKNSTVLILPEGNIINYLTDRSVDMHCFMMDRLYYDAYGKNKAEKLIADTNSDYIIILRGFNLGDFCKLYLYSNESSPMKYIKENYSLQKQIAIEKHSVLIYRKNK